jgi:hypothetical protein
VKNSAPQRLKRASVTAGTHTDLQVLGVQARPVSKAPAKVTVLSIVAINRKKSPTISVTDGKWDSSDTYQSLLHQNVLPMLSNTYPEGN